MLKLTYNRNFDDPDNQRQEKAYIPVGTNNYIIGSSQFGKTNLLTNSDKKNR